MIHRSVYNHYIIIHSLLVIEPRRIYPGHWAYYYLLGHCCPLLLIRKVIVTALGRLRFFSPVYTPKTQKKLPRNAEPISDLKYRRVCLKSLDKSDSRC